MNLTITTIFQRYGPAYVEKFRQHMPVSHLRTIDDICNCRTDTFGGHIDYCDHCGSSHFFHHSCYNRSCPQCQGIHTKKWFYKQQGELLPIRYFHVVFTVPDEIRGIIRSHPVELLNILIKAASLSVITLMADPKYGGGKPGLLCVLHTWTRTMMYHPHVHCLIPQLVISKTPSGWQWTFTKKKFLAPVQALSEIFRAIFIRLARKKFPQIEFPKSIWRKKWVVFSKATLKKTRNILKYLAQYIHRTAITNNRIISDHNSIITFKYQNSCDHKWRYVSLDAEEFIRRFLQHVLPHGFHKVRFYGFLAPAYKHIFSSIKMALYKLNPYKISTSLSTLPISFSLYSRICPFCKIGTLTTIAHLFYRKKTLFINRPPPQKKNHA